MMVTLFDLISAGRKALPGDKGKSPVDRVPTLFIFTVLAVFPGCSALMLTGDEGSGARVGKVAARSLLGLMTVGGSEFPYECVRRELSKLPESDQPAHRAEAWETCQRQRAQGVAASAFVNQPTFWWQDKVRRDERRGLRLWRLQQRQQQLYRQQQYQRQVYQQYQYQQQYQQRLYQQRLYRQPAGYQGRMGR